MRRSSRADFQGPNGKLAGILDLPDGPPNAVGVFTHCFTCNKDLKAIVRISRGLAEQGIAVLRYDLTGLGHSIGDFSLTNFSTNQSDLRSAVSFAQTAINAPLFLIGHSFGAACSLSVAQSLPDVRGVVSIAGPSDTRHLAEFLAKMDPAVEVNGTGSVHIGGRNYIIRKQMLEDFRRHDLPATLRNLAKPVLLFHSPADETLGYDHVLRIFACLNQRAAADPDPPPSSLITVPGADHLFVKDPADIDFVVSIVTGWVERMVSS